MTAWAERVNRSNYSQCWVWWCWWSSWVWESQLLTCYNLQIHFSVWIFIPRDTTVVRPRILFTQISDGHSENCCCCVVIQRESFRVNPFVFSFSLDLVCALWPLSSTKILCIVCIFSIISPLEPDSSSWISRHTDGAQHTYNKPAS